MRHLYHFLVGCLILAVSPTRLQAQTWQWLATSTGSATSTGVSDITATATDGAGNTVVVGTFSGTVTFGSTTLVSAGASDLFVGRVNASGAWTQAVRAGGPGNETAKGVAVDNSGNILVTGTFTSVTMAFDAFTLTNATTGGTSNDQDIFVARLNPAGSWTQAVRAGGNKADLVVGLTLDAAGNVTIAGGFNSVSAGFGATTLPNSDNTGTNYDIFVARLNNVGTWTQAVQAGNASTSEQALALAQDGAGNAYITGLLSSSTLTFGAISIANSGTSSDAFVARLNSAGTWTQAVAGGVSGVFEQPNAIAVDGSGNAVVAGLYTGSTSFGANPLPLPAGVTFGGFVARLSAAGIWTQAVPGGGTSGTTFPNAVAVDASGNATVAGQLNSATAQFGTIAVNSTGTGADVFVARLNTAGTWTYALRAGTSGVDSARDIFLAGTTATVAGQLGTVMAPFGFNSLPITATTATGFVARLTGLVSSSRPSRATESLVLLPNPAHGAVRLQSLVPSNKPLALILTDGLGREVRRQVLPAHTTATQLDLTGVAPGIYIVRCGAASGKVVVE
ncbi:SBBP repeat-containing protein [Hymenobacter rubripertinctus]|uniref:T9SS C-terminal target domain-containing protein n=1 Tax=Hymenobacter rubripertinctus TaxID=2029981 RepID=A0A418QNC0_9BACT|nr:SBBP repeat-containing protein [Hymenobacter rubripertinctus]RIY06649.1 hypothetical protein D0T11_18435 [Hymenobacter rubripertinctus]